MRDARDGLAAPIRSAQIHVRRATAGPTLNWYDLFAVDIPLDHKSTTSIRCSRMYSVSCAGEQGCEGRCWQRSRLRYERRVSPCWHSEARKRTWHHSPSNALRLAPRRQRI